MKLLRVLKPGPRTTVQDAGRRHYQQHGLAQGGAADRFAFLCANKLLDNSLDAACLELTLGGLHLEAVAEVSLSMTGADCHARLNGTPVASWQTLRLTRGDQLSFATPTTGRYSYLAIQGGVETQPLFGSRSVVVREKLQGHGVLTTGDCLEGMDQPPLVHRHLPQRLIPDYDGRPCLRVIPGYQHDQFTVADRARFVTSCYRISDRSDRMGYRLEGATLTAPPPGIVSEGIALGAVQVPGDGDPIVLLQDRQTIGGYPKLGTVCAVDCFRLAQRRPGQEVEFQWADLANVQAERMLMEHVFRTATWSADGSELDW